MNRLNNIEPTIDFTNKLGINNCLPFLDSLQMNNNNKLVFKFHHKSTNKKDHIHFYSHQKTKIQSGIIICFYQSAIKFCAPKFLNGEFDYIKNSFMQLQLQYPKSFIQQAEIKAIKIYKRKSSSEIPNNVGFFLNNNSLHKYIIFSQQSYLPNPSARAGYDTRSIFKRSLTGLNSELSFSSTSCLTKAEEPRLPCYLPIAGGRIIGFIPFPRVLVLCEMQSVKSTI